MPNDPGDRNQPTPPVNPAGPAPDGDKPIFKPGFAAIAGLVLLALTGWLLASFGVFNENLGLDGSAWDQLGPLQKLAARLMIPLVVAGTGLSALGAWMAVVEWRGSFREPPQQQPGVRRRGAVAPEKIIESVGKLKGAALVMVVGALLLLGAAWLGKDIATPAAQPDGGTATNDGPGG